MMNSRILYVSQGCDQFIYKVRLSDQNSLIMDMDQAVRIINIHCRVYVTDDDCEDRVTQPICVHMGYKF